MFPHRANHSQSTTMMVAHARGGAVAMVPACQGLAGVSDESSGKGLGRGPS